MKKKVAIITLIIAITVVVFSMKQATIKANVPEVINGSYAELKMPSGEVRCGQARIDETNTNATFVTIIIDGRRYRTSWDNVVIVEDLRVNLQ